VAATETIEWRPASAGRRLISTFIARREFGIFLVLVALILYFNARNSAFSGRSNWATLVEYGSPILIAAVGETMLLICGEIDLSVGHVYALAPLVLYKVAEHGWPLVAGLAIGLAAAALVGLVNGLVTVYLRVPSLIVTLGMFNVLNGISLLISDGSQQSTPTGPNFGKIFGVGDYHTFYWAFGIMLVMHFVLTMTPWGLHTIAVGGNRVGASESGVNVSWIRIGNFVMCSALGGFGGILTAQHIGTTDPLQGGTGLMFYGVAGAVIGGTALMGGSGTVLGSFIGVAVLTVLNNGFTLIGVDAFYNDLFIGTAILLSMALGYVIARVRRKPE
jgi:simple sugar transport system permease protein